MLSNVPVFEPVWVGTKRYRTDIPVFSPRMLRGKRAGRSIKPGIDLFCFFFFKSGVGDCFAFFEGLPWWSPALRFPRVG